MNLNKPTNIYETTSETTTVTKKFNYEKPEGWDRKPPKKIKISWLRRIKNGLFNVEMDASDQRKYDALIENIRVLFFTFTFVFLLSAAIFSSSFMSGKYTSEEYDPTYLDMGIDYISDLYDEIVHNKKPVPVTDTIYESRKDTISQDVLVLKELDSIIRKYVEDSTRIADSMKNLLPE